MDEERQERIRYYSFAAFVGALLLLNVTGVWKSIFGIDTAVIITLLAGYKTFHNSISALLFVRGRKKDLNINGAFLHMAGDAAISLGVVLAGLAILATGWDWLDPAISILIGGAIVWGTWGLLRESLALVMDAVPAGIDSHAVETYLAALPGVAAVHDLHIWGMSTTEVALTAHLVMPEPPADDGLLRDVCHELRARFEIGHVTIQIEHGDVACHQAPANVV